MLILRQALYGFLLGQKYGFFVRGVHSSRWIQILSLERKARSLRMRA